jgi:hypothetical protein
MSNKKILLLRISYWVGAVADGFASYRMLFPKYSYNVEYRYALGLGASLMIGWTFLLIWADRSPVERKGILLLTACPVVTGLLLAEIYAVQSGMLKFGQMIPTGTFLVGLIVLFCFSYYYAKDCEAKA